MSKTILITGGCGFIGANFVHYWAKKYPDDRLVILDKLTYAANPNALDGLNTDQVTLVVGDILDRSLVEKLFNDYSFDQVVHFAAESHVDRSITKPDEFIQTNIVGTHVLLEAAREYWQKTKRSMSEVRFSHVSTDEVFGSLGEDDAPFNEKTPYQPNSPYSASKAASDHLVRSYFHTYGLNVTTTNCSNNFGPRQDLEKLIPKTIDNVLHGIAIPIYGTGQNIRDWLYVKDHCWVIEQVLRHGQAGETYCIGGRNEMRNIDIVKTICDAVDGLFAKDAELTLAFPCCPAAQGLKSHGLMEFVEDRLGHDWRYAIDDSKLEAQLGPVELTSFDDAIIDTIQYYLGCLRPALLAEATGEMSGCSTS